jgi:hypothetical protein
MKKIIFLFSSIFALHTSFLSAYYTYPSYNYNNVNSVTATNSYTIGCTTYYYDLRTGAQISSKYICTTGAPSYNYYPTHNYGYSSYGSSNYTDYSIFTGYNNSYDAIIDGTYCNYGYNCANRAVTTYPQYNYQAWGYQNNCYSYYDTYYGYYKSSCGY